MLMTPPSLSLLFRHQPTLIKPYVRPLTTPIELAGPGRPFYETIQILEH